MKITANNKPLITIITSIYNTEKYLAKCIDSILGQTYNNIELILVNDGSTDNSMAICEDYQIRDNRITLINKKNTGAADSRNIAINRAKGMYISFVDSDDYIDKKFIETLFNKIISYNCQISACNYKSIYENGNTSTKNKPKIKEFKNLEAVRDVLIENSILETMLWNKLFKASLFIDNNIKMPVGDIYEDTRVIYKLHFYANKIVYTNQPLYYYLRRDGSVMNQGMKLKNLELQTIITKEARDWLNKKTNKLKNEIDAYILTGQINSLNYMVDNNNIHNEQWSSLVRDIEKSTKKILTNPYISRTRKLLCIFLFTGKNSYIILRKLYKRILKERAI